MVARRDIANALQMADGDGLNFTSATTQALEDCHLPVFNYPHDICGDWDRILYCLKQLARNVFAFKFQECIWTRGAGINGKGTLANCMKSLLDDYSKRYHIIINEHTRPRLPNTIYLQFVWEAILCYYEK